jgi:2-polyprenyl-3-methyl-5-hydroxy-6-metoxy-1,4-benzoquinol methylase
LSAETDTAFVAFERFSRGFCELISRPGLLEGAECRQSYKDHVPHYYGHLFGPRVNPLSSRHLNWYRRLRPLLSLPAGSSILDYGGGYGIDTIFLASLGYKVFFYEITPHHIGVARWFVEQLGEQLGPLSVNFVLGGKDPVPSELDGVLVKEVAHHIEPVQDVFDAAATMLRPGGHLFLLEPNFLCPVTQLYFFRVRGFRTVVRLVNEETGEEYEWGNEHIRPIRIWNRFASAAGFNLSSRYFVVPWFLRGPTPKPSLFRRGLEQIPLARHLIASHVTLDYVLDTNSQV